MISGPFVSLMRVAGPALILAGLLAALPAGAQQRANVPVVGWLGLSDFSIARDGLRQGLRELGYVEGQNIAIEYLLPEGRGDPFAGPIEELARLKVNIIISGGFPATAAVHRAALAIPVVFVVADPIGSGFARSLAHPGGNMAGLSLAIEEQFSGKWLELLKEAAPQVSRVAYLWNPRTTAALRRGMRCRGWRPGSE